MGYDRTYFATTTITTYIFFTCFFILELCSVFAPPLYVFPGSAPVVTPTDVPSSTTRSCSCRVFIAVFKVCYGEQVCRCPFFLSACSVYFSNSGGRRTSEGRKHAISFLMWFYSLLIALCFVICLLPSYFFLIISDMTCHLVPFLRKKNSLNDIWKNRYPDRYTITPMDIDGPSKSHEISRSYGPT